MSKARKHVTQGVQTQFADLGEEQVIAIVVENLGSNLHKVGVVGGWCCWWLLLGLFLVVGDGRGGLGYWGWG